MISRTSHLAKVDYASMKSSVIRWANYRWNYTPHRVYASESSVAKRFSLLWLFQKVTVVGSKNPVLFTCFWTSSVFWTHRAFSGNGGGGDDGTTGVRPTLKNTNGGDAKNRAFTSRGGVGKKLALKTGKMFSTKRTPDARKRNAWRTAETKTERTHVHTARR